MAKKGRKFNQYSIEIKAEAVRLYLEEGLGYRVVAKRLGLRSKTQVEMWVKRHQEERSFADERSRPRDIQVTLTPWKKSSPSIRWRMPT